MPDPVAEVKRIHGSLCARAVQAWSVDRKAANLLIKTSQHFEKLAWNEYGAQLGPDWFD